MNRQCFGMGILALAITQLAGAGEGSKPGAKSVYDFEMNSIDGKPVKLSSYKGKVLLIVNVASK